MASRLFSGLMFSDLVFSELELKECQLPALSFYLKFWFH